MEVLKDKRAEIMEEIGEKSGEALQRFGIDINDVRINRTELPRGAEENVYARMRAERERQAADALNARHTAAAATLAFADLDDLVGLDIFISFWGPTLYGHTIASWEFADGRHLAVSIETRKEQGEEYSAVRGFFRQFELYYVVSDESDVVALRTNQRGERVELYRTLATPIEDRAALLDYVREMNALAEAPRWYNALTHNCTTTIWHHAKAVGADFPLDWRLLANGYLVDLSYELGTVNTSLGLDELKRRSDITARAREAGAGEGFSLSIRDGLPSRPSTVVNSP